MSTVLDQQSATLYPQPGEQYAQFVRRAHYSLMSEVPDWQERNRRVWDAWESTNGDNLRDQARQFFGEDQFRFVPNVCYFSEHQTVGRDGRPVHYSFKELADIVEEQNTRADRHNYAAIASRHTFDGIVPEAMEPKVLGYAGAARLGMVGTKNPTWAIFVDEHHRKDAADVLAQKQRRSVEVNRYRDGRRPYFDPIAALGAESPRLPLPVARYDRNEDDAEVERYSVMAPAMVSGTNTFIPGFGGDSEKKKDHQQHYSEQQSMLGDQDIQAIVQAIRGTPEMQWVQQQMGGGGAAQPASAGGDMGMGGDMGAPKPQYGMHGAGGGLPRYQASEDADIEKLRAQYDELAEKYSQAHEFNVDLMKKHTQVREAVVNLEKRAVDAERSERLRDLYQQFPHFVDVEDELDRCLYSRGNDMDQEEFEAHCDDIEKYAKRSSPVTQMIPNGAVAGESDKERYSADLNQRVIERYTELANRGELKSYDEIEAEVRKQLAGA